MKNRNIIDNSQDSILEMYNYSNGILKVVLNPMELEENIIIEAKTGFLTFNNYYLQKKEELYRTCHIEIEELSNVLSMENGIYTPSSNFGKLMSESKANYNLAYGKKSSEYRYIFSLKGYDKLISCLISNMDSVKMYLDNK